MPSLSRPAFVFYRSKRSGWVLLLAAVAVLAAGGGLFWKHPAIPALDRLPSNPYTLGAIGCGAVGLLLLLVAVAKLVRRGRVVTIGPEGVRDRRTMRSAVRWDDIQEITVRGFRRRLGFLWRVPVALGRNRRPVRHAEIRFAVDSPGAIVRRRRFRLFRRRAPRMPRLDSRKLRVGAADILEAMAVYRPDLALIPLAFVLANRRRPARSAARVHGVLARAAQSDSPALRILAAAHLVGGECGVTDRETAQSAFLRTAASHPDMLRTAAEIAATNADTEPELFAALNRALELSGQPRVSLGRARRSGG